MLNKNSIKTILNVKHTCIDKDSKMVQSIDKERVMGIIMLCIGWYKKSKSDKKVFQYMKEQDSMNFSNQQS